MGFFKNIVKGVSNVVKTVSVKNVIKVATGQGGQVVKEAIDRVKTGVATAIGGEIKAGVAKAQDVVVGAITGGTKSAPTYSTIENALIKTGQNLSVDLNNKIVDKVAAELGKGSGATMNAANQAAISIFTKAWFQANWEKKKWWIIGVGASVVGLIGFLILRKRNPRKSTYRRR